MEYTVAFLSWSYEHLILFALGIMIGFLIKNVTENENAKVIKLKCDPDMQSIPRTSVKREAHAVSSTSVQHIASTTKILNVPKHVAVIMDGNRRYGEKVYGDPLKVR